MNRPLFFVLFLFPFSTIACGGSPHPAAAAVSASEEAPPSAPSPPELPNEEAELLKLAGSTDEATRRQALARLGALLRTEKRFAEAATAFQEAADANPLIRSYLLLEKAEVESQMGEHAKAAASLSAIAGDQPRSSLAQWASIRLAAALALSDQREKATSAIERVMTIQLDEWNDEDFASLARSLEKAGFTKEARALRLRILMDYPASRWTEEHYGSLAALPREESPLEKLSFAESLRLADRIGRANRYDQTLDLLDRIERRFPDQKRSAELRFVRARSLFNSRNYRRMTEEPSVPGEPHYLAIEMLRSRAYWRSERPEQFVAGIERIIREHPKSDQAGDAKFQLAKYYQTDEMDLVRSARLLEEGIAARGAGTEGQNLWTLAWTWILAGENQKALATFDRYLQRYPDADYTSNALFWSAKIHERLGNQAERDRFFKRLISFYPYTYYSYRAREILGDTTLPPHEIASGHRFPTLTPGAADPRLAVPRELRAAGLERAAAAELKRIAAAAPDDPVLAWRLAELYADAGENLRGLSMLGRTFKDIIRHGGEGLPDQFWEVLYPRRYWDEIQEAAKAARVDPWLALAVIRQESAWEPTTVSNAGAVGLMQIMPQEAPRIAEAAGIGKVDRRDLFDPLVNVKVGTAELRQKLDAMENHPVLAIAAYNAGETPVRRWVARTPIEDLDLFIDSIPYAETRLYVMTVTRNLHEYRRIYATE
ncbi:MAG TPA: transglycosylase SLT domain-containing protein [Thermoanaerobaculia bacterium]|nr:transglycosylase SLT domain-containing protein [Thermoanaerobaculia bacterium]